MSYSICIKCEKMVGSYEKYCDDCVRDFGVKQDINWHKDHYFADWEKRKEEFENDIAVYKERKDFPKNEFTNK